MRKAICILAVFAFMFSASTVGAQNAPKKPSGAAIFFANADMKAKLQKMIADKVQDDALRVVDVGDSNLGVFMIHLNPGQEPQAPVNMMSHNEVAEVYYVLSGEGFLYHGGTIENATPRDLTTTGGPSQGGPGKDTITQKVGPGDLFMITPNTPHQVNLGAKTEMVYLLVRVDLKKHLQLK